MFFAAGLGFSEVKAVRLRNAFSSHEIPFGFGWFIIFLFLLSEILKQPTMFLLVLQECLEGKKLHQMCAKSPSNERSPPWCWPLLSAFTLVASGVCVLWPGKRVWFGLVSFLQLQYKGLLAYTSVSKRTAQPFKKKSSLENSLD